MQKLKRKQQLPPTPQKIKINKSQTPNGTGKDNTNSPQGHWSPGLETLPSRQCEASTQGPRVVVRREQSQEFSVPAHGFFGSAAFSETLEASDLFA